MTNPRGGLQFAIVPAAEADLPAIAALVNEAFRRYAIHEGDRTSVAELAAEAGDTGEFILYRSGGEIVASAMIRPAIDALAVGSGIEDEARLRESLYFGLAAVAALHVNAGLGRRLVADAERIAGERGYRRVLLGAVREFGLIEYYARQGYIAYALHDYPAGHWGVTVPFHYCHMAKEL